MQRDQPDEDRLRQFVNLAERIAEIIAEQTRDWRHDEQRIEHPMDDPARELERAVRDGRGRSAASKAQRQSNGDQRKDRDAEIIVDAREIGIRRGNRLSPSAASTNAAMLSPMTS